MPETMRPHASAGFSLRLRAEPGGVRVTVTGRLDAATLPRLAAALRRAARTHVPLVLDLRAVTVLDAATESELARAREAGAEFVVLPPDQPAA